MSYNDRSKKFEKSPKWHCALSHVKAPYYLWGDNMVSDHVVPRLQASDLRPQPRDPIPETPFPIPYSLFPIRYAPFPIPHSLFPIPGPLAGPIAGPSLSS